MEIERKYLVNDSFKNIIAYESENIVSTDNIEQYYLLADSKEKLIKESLLSDDIKLFLNTKNKYRIRSYIDSKTYELTYKSDGIIAREEVNYKLSEDEYKTISKLLEKQYSLSPIRKCRVKIKTDDPNIFFELDHYIDNKRLDVLDLIVCEVELPSINYYFKKPEWLGKEISFLKEFSNRSLFKIINYKDIHLSNLDKYFEFFNIATNNISNNSLLPNKYELKDLILNLVDLKNEKGQLTKEDIISENNGKVVFFNNGVNINNNDLTYDKVINIVNIFSSQITDVIKNLQKYSLKSY